MILNATAITSNHVIHTISSMIETVNKTQQNIRVFYKIKNKKMEEKIVILQVKYHRIIWFNAWQETHLTRWWWNDAQISTQL